jgi:hypothetical protein
MRRVPAGDEPLCQIRLRAGRDLRVVDVSNAGVLVEGASRLLPGTHVDVHLVTREGRVLMRSRVVRAFVSHLEADAVRYRGALAFERIVDTAMAGYDVPDWIGSTAAVAGTSYPEAPLVDDTRCAERLSA